MIEWLISKVPDLVSPTFTAVVNVISVIGFLITIYLMISVRQIKKSFTSRIRVTELKNQLFENTSQMSNLLNDYDSNRHHISTTMANMEPVLQGIKKRLGWTERGKVKKAIKMINEYQNLTVNDKLGLSLICNDEANIRLIYNLLHGIISELEQWENDKRWSA